MSAPRNIELNRTLGYVVTKEEMGESRAIATIEKRLSD